MATWSLTDTQTSQEIRDNPLYAAFGYSFSGAFLKWSTGDLTYTLNKGDANPDGQTVADWTPALTQAIELAHADVSAVAVLSFTEISDQINGSDGADIDYWAYSSPGDSIAGYSYGVAGDGVFMDMADVYAPNSYTTDGLTYGGLNYRTVIHEILHNLGMGHPHDGYASLPGVIRSSDTGDFALNQNVYSVLSYNSVRQVDYNGEATSGYPFTFGTVDRSFGVLGTLDIAMLQLLYGANMFHATGDDIYEIDSSNDAGTHYKAIWDAGGEDEFRFSGAQDVRIDLRAATLDVADGVAAGGILSKAQGIYGGYSIAFGTVIENATGGSGNDSITGNDADNTLTGNDGSDWLIGGAGSDILSGGGGADDIDGGAGFDTLDMRGSAQGVTIDFQLGYGRGGDAQSDQYANLEAIEGSGENDLLYGDANANRAVGHDGHDKIYMGRGNDTIEGGTGDDTLSGGHGDDVIDGGSGGDLIIGGQGADTLSGNGGFDTVSYEVSMSRVVVDLSQQTAYGGDAQGDVISGFEAVTGSSYSDMLVGSGGDNVLDGGTGRDTLDGGAGDDLMIGALGRDTFIFDIGEDTIDGGADVDVVVFNALSSAFDVVSLGDGDWLVTDTARVEINYLSGIEYLEFLDSEMLA